MSRAIITRFDAAGRVPGSSACRVALGALVVAALFVGLSAQPAPLRVTRDGDRLRLSAPQLHFLQGAPLQQLHDGRSVTYVFTASLHLDRGQRVARVVRLVVLSYDIWEERFSVSVAGDPNASASRLTTAAAESWCLNLLSLPAAAAPGDKAFVVKFDCTLKEDPGEAGDQPSAATLTGLIDLFSRKTRDAPPRWEAVSPALRLADLVERTPR